MDWKAGGTKGDSDIWGSSLCSDDSDFSGKSEAICQFLDKRGHPVSVVQVGHHRAQQINRQSALQTAEKDNTDQIPGNKRQWNLT